MTNKRIARPAPPDARAASHGICLRGHTRSSPIFLFADKHDGAQPPLALVHRLLVLVLGLGVGDRPTAGLHVRDPVLDDDGADVDRGVEVACIAEVADRAAIAATLGGLQLVDYLHRAHLRGARERARWQYGAQRVHRTDVLAQGAGDRGDDVHNVAVGLDLHQLVDHDAAVLAHASQVVASQVDEHHVLGALLLVFQQLVGDAPILLRACAARARTGDRARGYVARGDGEQRLGAGTGDLEIAEVQEVHIGTWVDGAQAPVYGKSFDWHLGREALRRHDLEGVARIDVLDDPRHHRFKVLARHVRLKARRRAPPGFRALRHGTGQACAHFSDRALRGLASQLRIRLRVQLGVSDNRDRVLEMIERDQRIGQHQRHVRQTERIRVRLAERLDGAHQVIAEEAHGTSREWELTDLVG